MNLFIRKMQNDDIKQVQSVAKNSWHTTYKGIIPKEIQDNFLGLTYSDEMMKRRINESIILVAEIEERIVGFANFTEVNEAGQSELSAIYLHPNYQGKGIGSALLEEGIAALDRVKEIYLDVEKENEVGRTFYEAKGFIVVKEFDDNFDGHILKTVQMCLKV